MFANHAVFLWLNASGNASSEVVDLAIALATWPVFIVPAVLVALWVWGVRSRRAALLTTAVSAALALGINQLLGLLWYEPRPFVAHVGRTLMTHAPDNSFPSDHATLMLTVGFGLIVTRAAPRVGLFVIAVALPVAWARVYLGVHFPLDMIASAVVAAVGGTFGRILVRPLRRWAMPPLNVAYSRSLEMLRLPERLFPRGRRV